jgi:hypothetical protein
LGAKEESQNEKMQSENSQRHEMYAHWRQERILLAARGHHEEPAKEAGLD